MEAKKMIKVTKEEANTLDRAKRGASLVAKPKEQDIAGQQRMWILVECPWCGNHWWSYIDIEEFQWFTCCYCGGDQRGPGGFRA